MEYIGTVKHSILWAVVTTAKALPRKWVLTKRAGEKRQKQQPEAKLVGYKLIHNNIINAVA